MSRPMSRMEAVNDFSAFGLLFAAGIVAGFVDTLAGGGGLITLPALLLTHMPLLNALATNRLQALAGTFTASAMLIRGGLVCMRQVRPLFVGSLLGSVAGTGLALVVDPKVLDIVIPFVLACVALYFLAVPYVTKPIRTAVVGRSFYGSLVVPLIGLYGGMLGPGTGSLFAAAGMSLRGQSLVRATATAKMLDGAANLASFLIFALGGKVVWLAGATMIAGQIVGAYL